MKGKIAAVLIALATVPGLLILAAPGSAQFKSTGDKQKQDYETAKKKPDDSQYKAAIERMPEKKFDPWQNMR